MIDRLRRFIPVLDWGRTYNGEALSNDLIAAVIVTIMLIPQSLAYALLAGLPPEAGIYASIVPIVLYAIFGTSRALAVGPVAVVSLLTASAAGQVADQGTAGYVTAALTLAFLSGGFLLLLGILRLGFLANFLSHPVIAGFIAASGILIAASQLKHILGVQAGGHTLIEMLGSLIAHLGETNVITLTIGVAAIAFLFWARKGLKPLLRGMGFGPKLSDLLTKAGPVAAVVATTLVTWYFSLNERGVSIVGEVPQSLPPLTMPGFAPDLLTELAVPAILISIIGFVESVSVAQTLAAKKRQHIDPDQELIGLGAANLGAAFTGGYPVTGGFARSVVNFDAGAETPAAGAYTAIGLAIAAVALTPAGLFPAQGDLGGDDHRGGAEPRRFVDPPKRRGVTPSRTSPPSPRRSCSRLGSVSRSGLRRVSRSLRAAASLQDLEATYRRGGLSVPGTQHFRNINRHEVETDPTLRDAASTRASTS